MDERGETCLVCLTPLVLTGSLDPHARLGTVMVRDLCKLSLAVPPPSLPL